MSDSQHPTDTTPSPYPAAPVPAPVALAEPAAAAPTATEVPLAPAATVEPAAKRKPKKWVIVVAVIAAIILLSAIVNAVDGGKSDDGATAPDAPAAAPAEQAEAPAEQPTAAKPAPEPQKPTVQQWADQTWGTFAAATQSGTGDSMIVLPAGSTHGIVTATHDGSSNFVVSVLDSQNQPTGDLLVNTIGGYSGTTGFGFTSLGDSKTLQITADGNWTITIAPVSAAPAFTGSGTGDAVMFYEGAAAALTATHDGSSNFVIREETGKAFSFGLLVNEIGAYTGTVPLSAGPSLVQVTADGNWTLATQ